MPYRIGRSSQCPVSAPYAVVKTGDGRVMGCHKSKERAMRQMVALNINEKSMELTTKAPIKRENGIDYPARDYAFVPDPLLPSTWKLRLTETPGKVTVAQLARAAAALSPGGFRGNRADIPDSALAAVKRRIRAEYRRLGVPENRIPNAVKEASAGKFEVWKQADGQYRWFAAYSNNFRDNDFPPEIISAESQETFVKMVDAEIVPYPELWHWHIPGTRWGQADFLDFVNGVAIAGGTIDPGREKEAEALARMEEVAVSHGMPSSVIMRDPLDDSVITRHVTREISPLPRWAAANKLTDFVVFKTGEKSIMGLDQAKKDHLRALGFDDARIEAIEQYVEAVSKSAQAAGIESKEETVAATEAVEPSETETQVAAHEEADDKEEPVYVTREEIADAIVGSMNGVLDAVRAVSERISALESQVKELQVKDGEKVAALKEVTPTLSLRELVAKGLQTPATRLDANDPLLTQKPKEASVTETVTGIPFLDQLVMGNRK